VKEIYTDLHLLQVQKECGVSICVLIKYHYNLLCHSEVTIGRLVNYYYSYYWSYEISSKL